MVLRGQPVGEQGAADRWAALGARAAGAGGLRAPFFMPPHMCGIYGDADPRPAGRPRLALYLLAARCGGPSARMSAAGTLRTGYCEKVSTNTISVEVMYQEQVV